MSDSLLAALLAAALLLAWRRYAEPIPGRWWPAWCCLGLAVLTKGPVAIALFDLTLMLYQALQGDGRRLRQRLHPLAGLGLTSLVALPWYLLDL